MYAYNVTAKSKQILTEFLKNYEDGSVPNVIKLTGAEKQQEVSWLFAEQQLKQAPFCDHIRKTP